MKIVLISIMKAFLKFCYMFIKAFNKEKNQIVILSRQSNNKSLDMKLLEDAILTQSPDTKIIFRLKMIDDGLSSKIKYFFYLFGDMKAVASSKVAIVDTYSIVISCLNHRKSLKVIQMWHALGAIKKFGLQSLGTKDGRDEKISRAMCMHKNYDYILAPSTATAKFYMEGFGYEASAMKICPLPRVDYILSKDDDMIHRFFYENPSMADKKIVLYLPTFRDRDAYAAQQIKVAFEDENRYRLIVSSHPLSKVKRDERYFYNGEYNIYDLMKVANIIVTDYSASAFEASLLMKPLYFFVPDYDRYMRDRGINTDIKSEMGSAVFEDADELVSSIKNVTYNTDMLDAFRSKFVERSKTGNAELFAKFVLMLMESENGSN